MWYLEPYYETFKEIRELKKNNLTYERIAEIIGYSERNLYRIIRKGEKLEEENIARHRDKLQR